MRALFALATGVVLGTIAALWLAARRDLHPAPTQGRAAPRAPELDAAPAEAEPLPPTTAESEEASA